MIFSESPRPSAPDSCPTCLGPLTGSSATGSFCLRCAGIHVLELESMGRSSNPPGPGIGRGAMRQIGPYEVIEELGRGGMGCVYAARQMELGRIVALKVIAVGPSTSAELEMRFLREAQTMARLRHANIVTVHESGRADGCVYFSMDYIEGGDLAARLRTEPPGFREAADLVRKLAGALAYAHAQGVLHRDLKPSNILMDGNEPKLADFGLAAELEAGGDLTRVTSILGTPHYLAPEAVSQGSAALGPASDQYALGVVLFQLLTGRTPFAGASPAQLPSLLAAADPPAPRLLAPAVPRDLETICLKCLEREPARRYESAAALEEDLRRYLAGEPVRATPPSPLYLFRKFARRHFVPLAASIAVAVVLVLATAESSWLAIRASRAEKRASAEAAASQAVTDFLKNDILAQASPSEQPDRDLPLRVALDRAASKVDERFRAEPMVASSLHVTLAAAYDQLGEYAAGRHHWERALDLRQMALGRTDADGMAMMDKAAMDRANQGDGPGSEALELKAIDLLQRGVGPNDRRTLEAMDDLSYVFKANGKLAEAEAAGIRIEEASRRALGPTDAITRSAMNNLSSVYFAEDKLPQAESLNLQALDLYQKALGPDAPDTLSSKHNLASVYWEENKFAEAEKLNIEILEVRKRILGPEHPLTLESMHSLATTYQQEYRLNEATTLEAQTLALRRKVLGPDAFATLSSANSLAADYAMMRRIPEAEVLAATTFKDARRALGADHYLTLNIGGRLANIYDREGRLPEAESLFREILPSYERIYGPEGDRTLLVLDSLGTVLLKRGNFAESEALLRRSLAGHLKADPDDWETFNSRSGLGASLTGLKRYQEAEPLLLEAYAGLKSREATIPPPSKKLLPTALLRIVQLYEAWGKPGEAEHWKSLPK